MLKQCRYRVMDGELKSCIFPADAELNGWFVDEESALKAEAGDETSDEKDILIQVAREQYGVKLNKRMTVQNMKAKLEELADGDSSANN